MASSGASKSCGVCPPRRTGQVVSTKNLAGLLDRIEPKRSVIDDLANEGHTMDWFCFVRVEHGQGGVVLSVDLMRRLAALPIQLGLDIYGIGIVTLRS